MSDHDLKLIEAKLKAALREYINDVPRSEAILGLLKIVWEAQADQESSHKETALEVSSRMQQIIDDGVTDRYEE
jgi:hypothetical protein